MFRLLALFCLAAVATIAAADDAPPTDPKAELQGRWLIVSCNDTELRGDPDKPNLVTLTFDADNFVLNITNDGGVRELAGGFTVDAAPTPQLIDFMIRGDDAATTIFGIYRISGDRLTLRWRTDENRPGDFTSPKAEFDTTFVFRRERVE